MRPSPFTSRSHEVTKSRFETKVLDLRPNCLDSQVALTRSCIVVEPQVPMMSIAVKWPVGLSSSDHCRRPPHVCPSQANTGSCPKATDVCQPRSPSAGPLKKQNRQARRTHPESEPLEPDLHPKHGLVLHLTAEEARTHDETSSYKTGLGRSGQVRFEIEPTSPRDSTATWRPVPAGRMEGLPAK